MRSPTRSRHHGLCDGEVRVRLPALDSAEWSDVLHRGLGASSRTLETRVARTLISVFGAGPFKVAYPDFPVGAQAYPRDVQAAIVEACQELGVDVVRFHSRERLGHPKALAERQLGTSVITDLQSWSEAHFDKARRARNRAGRSPLVIGPALAEDGARLHRLYMGTVGRHGGSVRYGADYFKAIAPFATLVAKHEGAIRAFVCFAALHGCAYYLHGAIDPDSKALYPSDQLFREMIGSSSASGATQLDFLPSPPRQASLVRYKESWGAVSAPFVVTDVAIHPFRAMAFEAASHISGWLPGKLLMRAMRNPAGRAS